MKSSGLFRIGRDAELRYLPNGNAVCNLSLAFNYGKKGDDGNRPTQWIDAALFGQRAEILAPMLLKGSQHVFHLSDLHIETYEGANGQGTKLTGFVDDVELTDRRDGQGQQQQGQQRQQGQGSPQRQAPQGNPQNGNQGQQRQQPDRQQGNQGQQGNRQAQPQNNNQQRQQPAQRQAPQNSSGFDDMDDDIPF